VMDSAFGDGRALDSVTLKAGVDRNSHTVSSKIA
jgi:hypothetical protein